MKLKSPYLVKGGSTVKLSSFKTDDTGGLKEKDAAGPKLEKRRKQLDELQEVFYASQAKALLIVLQGMDTAGKDGTIRSIFSGVNPQGCQVAAFKVPTSLEARHDFLWRCHAEVPPRGMIGIFNRSHYEDVLSPRVHGKLSKKQVQQHLESINSFEEMLVSNDVVVLKFFLHISHDEQTRRLQSRIDTPDKHWKLSPSDFEERRFWGDYMAAYEDIFRETSHKHAPWFIIPSDHKWYRNIAISAILVQAMQGMDLKYPPPTFDPTGIDLSTESAKEVAEQAGERVNPSAPEPGQRQAKRSAA